MNKKSKLLLILVVATLTLGIAVTATAGPNCRNPKFADDPLCSPPTTTTTPTQPPQLEACTTEMTITGKGYTSFECLRTPVEPREGESTVAKVTVSGLEGGVKGPPVVFVRDDAPGDICLLEQGWDEQTGPEFEASFDLFYDEVPVGYEAWLGRSYWDFVYENEDVPTVPIVGAYWCAPQDPAPDSLHLDTNGTPLHLAVNFNARGGGQLTINLYPGQG